MLHSSVKCCMMCTHEKPQERPLMSSVGQILSNISKELQVESPNGKQQKDPSRQ